MERRDNYAVAAAQARRLFAGFDHAALARKLNSRMDGAYFYVTMLAELYRIHRVTGDISRCVNNTWVDANSFAETLTLLDLVCDSQENRHPTYRWKNMQEFGNQVHRGLCEPVRNAQADAWQAHADVFAEACVACGGKKYPLGDEAYAIEVFDGLCVLLQLWFGDDEFPAQIRWLWDENALQYLKYETMYYAVDLITKRINDRMKPSA